MRRFVQKAMAFNGQSGGSGGSGDGDGWITSSSMNPSSSDPIGEFSCIRIDCVYANRIEDKAWMDSGLSEINLPEVETIGNFAFMDCINLVAVNAPKVKSIGEYAFDNCKKLTTITLPSANSIGPYVFNDCIRLTKIDLGSATTIGIYAFRMCLSLTTLILRTTETVCVIDLTAFDDSPFLFNPSTGTNNGYIYVPAVMYEYYRAGYEEPLVSVLGEGAFDRIVRKIEDYPEICG